VQASQTRRQETLRSNALEKYHTALTNVEVLEADLAQLGFEDLPWTPSSPNYVAAIKYSQNRKYHRALNKVQQLVVQRLFELQKAHMSGVGVCTTAD
jgi:hypothetical protein